jgi:DNA polymerase III delta subunit
MDFASFTAELRGKKGPAPAVVFAGPEALLRDRGLAALKESDPGLGANAVRVSSSETDWTRIADELYTPPFFGGKKLVVLVDEGNFVHNNRDEIAEYLKGPSTAAVLAVLSPSEKVPALSGAWLVECRSLKPGDLQRWLVAEAQRLGKTLDRAAAELLASRGGGNLSAQANHLEKLAAHVGARGAITADDVRALVGNEEERQVYELSLAAASKDGPRAFRVLRALLSAGEAVQVLVWKLAWQYRKLAEAKQALRGHLAAADHLFCGRVPPARRRAHARRARRQARGDPEGGRGAQDVRGKRERRPGVARGKAFGESGWAALGDASWSNSARRAARVSPRETSR